MRTITKNLYGFDELSPEAKERAIQKTRESDGYLSYDWWDGVYDFFTEDMKAHGIQVEKIYFSGFWCQGDGACFEGFIKIPEHLLIVNIMPDELRQELVAFNAKAKLRGLPLIELSYNAVVKHSGHYYHSHSMGVTSYDNYRIEDYDAGEDEELQQEANALINKLWGQDFEDLANEICRDHADDLYKDLEKEYEYLTSDEAIAEHLVANDYEFDEDGALVR
jgi:hypothetical protein